MTESHAVFEARAVEAMASLTERPMRKATIAVCGSPRSFDAVSDDGRVVGDAKRLTWGLNQPAAKLSGLSEIVLHLSQVHCNRRLLVCGGDRRVPEKFLDRWRGLTQELGVEVYFLDERLERLC